MANLTEETSWTNDLYRIETTDPVEGGETGIDNIQAKQLGRRTRALRGFIDGLFEPDWVDGVPAMTGLKLKHPLVGPIALGDGSGIVALAGHPYCVLQSGSGSISVADDMLGMDVTGTIGIAASQEVVISSTSSRVRLSGNTRITPAGSSGHVSQQWRPVNGVSQGAAGNTLLAAMEVPQTQRILEVAFLCCGSQGKTPRSRYMAELKVFIETVSNAITVLSTPTVAVLHAEGDLDTPTTPTLTVTTTSGFIRVHSALAGAPTHTVSWSVLGQIRG